MAIQPIDLSTVYSQMDKLGQIAASQTHAASFANDQAVQRVAKIQSEKAQSVQEAENNSESTGVKEDGHQGGSGAYYSSGKKKQDESQEEPQIPNVIEFRDSGSHIDITG